MILIADSGSTKVTWCLLDRNNRTQQFETEGYNPFYPECKDLQEILLPKLPAGIDTEAVELVAFYGAGVYEEKHDVIRDAMHPVFPNARIEAASDMLASPRALLGRSPGFAAILGTGCNSCLYDGEKITHNIDSLGFLLGDEGSGCYMGKRLIADYIRGYMPKEIHQAFWEKYRLTGEELISQVYFAPLPNQYCATYTRFLTGDLAGHEYFEQRIIRDSFRDFFNNIVKNYPDYQKYKFNSVGSLGCVFRDQLTEVASSFGMIIGNIIPSPMEGLIVYHKI